MSVLSAAPSLVVTPTSVSERISAADDQPKASERRVSTRVPAELVPTITGVRLSPFGGSSALVNISTSGLLVKGDRRVLLGTALTISFAGTFSPATARGRVARCEVRSIEAGVVWYDIAIAFETAIPLEEPRKEEPAQIANAAALPPSQPASTPEPQLEEAPAPQDAAPLLYNRW